MPNAKLDEKIDQNPNEDLSNSRVGNAYEISNETSNGQEVNGQEVNGQEVNGQEVNGQEAVSNVTTVISGTSGQEENTLPASTPEFAPAVQTFVTHVQPENIVSEPQEASSSSVPVKVERDIKQQSYELVKQLMQNPLIDDFVQQEPRFEVNTNVRQVLMEVQELRSSLPVGSTNEAAIASDAVGEIVAEVAAVRATVERIWEKVSETEAVPQPISAPTSDVQEPAGPSQELIQETRVLVRSVHEELNASRNNTIQLTNQMRMVMDVTARCLREMDTTVFKYEQREGESPLLDELRSLRDMLADGFENARLEPIAPQPGDPFRYGDHRPEAGSSANGKIKRTLYPGFRWTQPNPPVVLLPALVETE